jgi:hypothetical protein
LMVSRLSGGQEIAGSTPATLTPTAGERRNEPTMQVGVRYLAKASMERLLRLVGSGSIAQLGERLRDMQEVAGAEPAVPTGGWYSGCASAPHADERGPSPLPPTIIVTEKKRIWSLGLSATTLPCHGRKTSSILVGTASPGVAQWQSGCTISEGLRVRISLPGHLPSSRTGTGPRLLSEELRVRVSPRALDKFLPTKHRWRCTRSVRGIAGFEFPCRL